ncbi:omega-hydroxypalmitate O-feruloyl transferase-like isoform X1 [Canna indica]|uniref:Omega-hydroxypalmitate O-feruloyl transferase-like isoform X1 n=1 Tax=Canna indica TaxID=4628 RepID=A0AAQ3L332_9LILI|nr:omega-hydroxypalmitate O-feruloyl transferase-like isoform X1 [Canna indica]
MDNRDSNGVATLTVTRSEPVRVQPAEHAGDEYYFLSNLDQNIAGIMKTVHLFAATSRSNEDVGQVLRDALAKVLVRFYPFAGSLAVGSEGKLIVKCNGHGVPFVEAAAAESGIEVLGDISIPDHEKLGMLVYVEPEAKNLLETPLLTVQVTRFKCGGFVLGLAMNHCMADGLSCVEFLHSWAETARYLPMSIVPFLDRTIQRAREPPKVEFSHPEYDELKDESNLTQLESEPTQYRSFTFDSKKLGQLKNMAMEDGSIKSCTSFMVLSALIWRSWARALNMDPRQKTKLLFAVDVRQRFGPPLPDGFFGNGIALGCCLCEAGELQNSPLSFAASLIQTTVRNMTDRYIRSAMDFFELNRSKPSLTATLIISTWTKLEFVSSDFGWGEAVQSGPAELPQKVALFLPQVKGIKSTRVVIGMPTSSMKAFQKMLEI